MASNLSTEVAVLTLSGLLTALQFGVMAVAVNVQLGPRWTAGPRDEPRQPAGMAGRLYRAFNNQLEGLLLFTAAVAAVQLSGTGRGFTEVCAVAYLCARVAYLPAYASGIYLMRSIIWAVGFFATVAMFGAVLIG